MLNTESMEASRARESRDATRDYTQRMRSNGLDSVNLWVPAGDRDRIREYARQLREEAGLPLLSDLRREG